METIKLYRVRKSFSDIKSGKGSFFTLEAAIKTAKRYGLKVFDHKGNILFDASNLKRRNHFFQLFGF